MKIDVFVFCAGKGTRMYPYTVGTPKALLPLGKKTFILLEICRKLKSLGANRVVVNCSYRYDLFVKAAKRMKDELGIEMLVSRETEPLGHGGGLKQAENLLKKQYILAINGDTIISLREEDIKGMFSLLSKATPFVFLAHVGLRNPLLLGENNEIIAVNERTFVSGKIKGSVDSSGVYLIKRSVLDVVPRSEFFGFWGENDVVEVLTKKGWSCKAYLPRVQPERISVGNKEEYERLISKCAEEWHKISSMK